MASIIHVATQTAGLARAHKPSSFLKVLIAATIMALLFSSLYFASLWDTP